MREAVDLLGQDNAGQYDVVDGQTDDEDIRARHGGTANTRAALSALR